MIASDLPSAQAHDFNQLLSSFQDIIDMGARPAWLPQSGIASIPAMPHLYVDGDIMLPWLKFASRSPGSASQRHYEPLLVGGRHPSY